MELAISQALTYRQRIHNTAEFQRVYSARTTVHTPSITVCFCANGLKWTRLGLSVSSKNGNAVRRNRIKRVFRAAFRQCQHEFPAGLDIVLIPKRGAKISGTADVLEALQIAIKRLKK